MIGIAHGARAIAIILAGRADLVFAGTNADPVLAASPPVGAFYVSDAAGAGAEIVRLLGPDVVDGTYRPLSHAATIDGVLTGISVITAPRTLEPALGSSIQVGVVAPVSRPLAIVVGGATGHAGIRHSPHIRMKITHAAFPPRPPQ